MNITSPTRLVPICAGGWGRTGEARAAYDRALALAQQEPERRFLARRLKEL